jgi:small-conductance mechanosensitive channel
MPIRNNLRIAILERFRQEGIDIPYPTQEVQIRREAMRPRSVEPVGEARMVIEAVEPEESEDTSITAMKPPQDLRSRNSRRRGEG